MRSLHHHLSEFGFSFTGEADDALELRKHNLLDDFGVDLMGSTPTALLPVCGAGEVFLAVIPVFTPYMVHLVSAVTAEDKAGQHVHFSKPRWSAFALADPLNDCEGFLVDDRFMGVLKDLPF